MIYQIIKNMAKKTTKALKVVDSDLTLHLPAKLKEKLIAKRYERNEDLILDKIEELELLRNQMKKTVREINSLAGYDMFEENESDDKKQTNSKQK